MSDITRRKVFYDGVEVYVQPSGCIEVRNYGDDDAEHVHICYWDDFKEFVESVQAQDEKGNL